MALPTLTKQWLDIASTTIENYRPQFYDNITDASAILKVAKQRDSVMLDGGDGIVETLMYAHNNTVGSYSGYDLMDLTPQNVFTAAKYEWKDVAGSMVFSQDDIDRNRGKSQMKNLLNGRKKNLQLSFGAAINTMLNADGSGNSSKDISGLQNLVHVRSSGTVGGINRANEAWWRNVSAAYGTPTSGYLGFKQGGTAFASQTRQYIGGSATDDYDTTFVSSLEYIFDEVTFGDTGPNLMVMDQATVARLKRSMYNLKRFDMADTGRADPGIRHVNFNGAPVVWDRAVKTGLGSATTYLGMCYFLNLDFMNFYVHSGNSFRTTEIHSLLPQQNAFALLMFLKAQWTVNKGNAQAVLHSISAG